MPNLPGLLSGRSSRAHRPAARAAHCHGAFGVFRFCSSTGRFILIFSVLSATLIAFTGARSAGAAEPTSLPTFRIPSLPPSAQAEAVFEGELPQLRATLVVSMASPARIGVLFELAPGWHLYWRNPGETGVAPEIELEAFGHAAGPIAWPIPETFREADDLFTTYGYEDRVLLSAHLSPTSEPKAEPTNAKHVARAQATVLVCRTQCVPASFSLEWPLAAAIDGADGAFIQALFQENDQRVPRRASELGWEMSAAWPAGTPAVDGANRLVLSLDACPKTAADCTIESPKSMAVSFLPFENETLEFGREQRVSIDSMNHRITLELDATRLEPGEDRLRGIVEVRESKVAVRYAEIDLPIRRDTQAGAAPAATGTHTASDWIEVFLLALLGGLILNGMPCVLPVLAIKVVSIADMAERDSREVRMHGLAYTAGVLGSMLLLASLVLGLRFAGHSVGWGFQFQEPLFVAGIAALLVTFALNLFGVFEIELGQGRLAAVGQDSTGLSRSVFEGLLAVVLATPCTAPFLGTAVGFAFASSGYGILAIFVAIGVGLASPFLLVSFFPRLARFIPRSGPWMLKLRAGLGFCLLATVIWLLWIVGQSGGTDSVVALTAALLFLGFLLWSFGQMQPMRSPWLGRASAVAIAALAFTSFNLIDFAPTVAASGDPNAQPADGDFQPYSEAVVRAALAAGTPAFVVFTADWCITCKVNESRVLDRSAVHDALVRGGYARFRADWTRRDDGIRKKLAEFGRAGVPLYLVYDPATPDHPRVLSEVLTQDAVITALALSARVGQL